VPIVSAGRPPDRLRECLPDFVTDALREALPVFGRQMAGYDHPDVVMTGVETRTSSPVRIRAEKTSRASTPPASIRPVKAGYAGGILSAAVDGIRVAEALAARVLGPRGLPHVSSASRAVSSWLIARRPSRAGFPVAVRPVAGPYRADSKFINRLKFAPETEEPL
jgi:hypothetical protein